MRVAVAGGGISGLATAWYLRQHWPEAEILVLEKEERTGGTMHTAHVDGYLFEAGANGFLSNRPETLELVDAIGAAGMLLRSTDAARIRYLYTDGLHRLPENPRAFFSSDLLGTRDKLRVMGEILVPAKRDGDEESLQQFGYRRLGKAFTDTFLDAMSAGIHAATPATLSVAAAFPAIVRLEREYGGLFRGMIRRRRREAGPGGVLMSFAGGVGSFIERLAAAMEVELRTGTQVMSVIRGNGCYRVLTEYGETVADRVVLATPAYASARILARLDPRLSEQLQAIPYSPVAVVGLGYAGLRHALNGFGLLTTTSSGQEILGVLWDSAIFPDRAPAGKKSLRILIGGQRQPELVMGEERRLVELAVKGVRETMGITEAPETTYVKRWEQGIPHYRPGHVATVRTIRRLLQSHPGIHLNSNAYDGIGLNDCVANARKCASQITGYGASGTRE